jgi:hypothetical protein
MTLPTAANPHVEGGGLCGESKSSILDQVTGDERRWIADYIQFRAGSLPVSAILERLEARGLSFPVVLKPDIGCHGDGVRLIANIAVLESALRDFDDGVDLQIQEFVAHESEAGVFYIRPPGAAATVTSLTLKHAPFVVGDGTSKLRDLIERDERTGRISHLYFDRLQDRLSEIVPAGERVTLVFTGNHCKGSIFRNGEAEITPALTARIDAICSAMPDFHFGRIDLRFRDIASLRRGEDFRIIEINGVGSEATHIWDPATTLLSAYRAQFDHYRAAFQIGNTLRGRGYKPMKLIDLFRLWRKQGRLMASYPPSD